MPSPSPIRFLLNYIYRPINSHKMAVAHVLQPLIAGGNIALPLTLFQALKDFQAGEFPMLNLAISAGLVTSNMVLPRLHDYLIESTRNTVQREITVDMVGTIYDRAPDASVGQPTGAAAVLTSKNYGTVGEIMPTAYGLLVNGLEITGISYLLAQWYGLPGFIPVLGLSCYLASSMYLEGRTESLKNQNSQLRIVGFTSLLGAINNYIPAHQFGKTQYELNQLRTRLTTVEASYTALDRAKQVNAMILSLVKQLPMLVLISTIGYTHLQTPEALYAKEFLLSLYYLLRFSSLMDPLPTKLNTLSNGLVDAKLLVDFDAQRSAIPDPDQPAEFKHAATPTITFSHVTFKYPGTEIGGLSDVSFEVRAGQKIVIMGPTGCGKTTILKLLQRFYNCEGTIEVNGTDVTQLPKAELRSAFAIISQEAGLPAGTLYGNIDYGNPSTTTAATPDEKNANETVFQAAEYAGLEFSRTRFFEPVSQQGLTISGGERQRIGVARFLIRAKINSDKSKIFLMDEPTSALDQQKSAEVVKVLDQLVRFGAAIMITHDPALAANADQILYMEQGKIVERGTFNELMALKGKFYNQMLAECNKLQIDINSIKPNSARTTEDSNFSTWVSSPAPAMQ